MALPRSTWLAGVKFLRSGLFHSHGPVLRPPLLLKTVEVVHQPSAFRSLFYKSPGSTMDALRIWKLLEWLGMDYCRIVRIRRRMKRFSYPWLTYCIPAGKRKKLEIAEIHYLVGFISVQVPVCGFSKWPILRKVAFILAVGDFIAQYHLKPHDSNRTFWKFLTEDWVVGETLLFGLLGFFPVGFILCKWNLFFYRKLRCHGKLSFLLTKLLLDLFILSPILLTLLMLGYGAVYGRKLYKEDTETIKQTLKDKYWPAIKESMIFNIATRPPALFGIFYLAPIHLRRLLKTVYEMVFATYVTGSIRKNVEDPSSDSLQKLANRGNFVSENLKDNLVDSPLSRWGRYKRWACRNRED